MFLYVLIAYGVKMGNSKWPPYRQKDQLKGKNLFILLSYTCLSYLSPKKLSLSHTAKSYPISGTFKNHQVIIKKSYFMG